MRLLVMVDLLHICYLITQPQPLKVPFAASSDLLLVEMPYAVLAPSRYVPMAQREMFERLMMPTILPSSTTGAFFRCFSARTWQASPMLET